MPKTSIGIWGVRISSRLLQEDGIRAVAFETSPYHQERLSGTGQKVISRRMKYVAISDAQAAEGYGAADAPQHAQKPLRILRPAKVALQP